MDLQQRILDYCEESLRSTGLDDDTICYILRFFHTLFPFGVAMAVIFGSKKTFYILMGFNLLVYCLFLTFKGCILTRLEKRFCDEDFIVADPCLTYFDMPVNHDNRFKFTVYWFILNFFLSLCVYYFRFIYKWRPVVTEIKTI